MAGNAYQFAVSLEREAKEFTAGVYRKFREKLLLEAAGIIDETWPVDTGFSRGSNLPFVGSPDSIGEATGPDRTELELASLEGRGADFGAPSDRKRVAGIRAVLKGTKAFDTVGIATNVVYAPALEDGHSDQGSHMYRQARNAIEGVVER